MKKIVTIIFLFVSFGSFAQTSVNEVLSFSNNCVNPTADSGGVVIKTKLPFGSPRYMPTIVVEGFNYGTGQSIGLMINYYVYDSGSGNHFNTLKVSSHGGYAPDVYLYNDAGFVSVFLKRGISQYCLSFKARAWLRTPTDGGATADWFTGWTAAGVNAPPVATSHYTKVVYQNSVVEGKGTGNSAVGPGALNSNETGQYNSAMGVNALYNNVKGKDNVAIGTNALLSNVAKSSNTAVGIQSQFFANNNVTEESTYNTSVGIYSLRGSEASASNTGKHNSAFGAFSLLANTSGTEQSAFGFYTLYNSTGSYNSAFGSYAGHDLTTGSANVMVGRNTGRGISSGSGNTIIGADLTNLPPTLSNTVIIGASSQERMRIDQNGNVGIGTTSPGTKLDVAGTFRSNRAIFMGVDPGSLWNHGSLEIREINNVLNTQSSEEYAPRIVLHWGWRSVRSIALGNNGNIKFNSENSTTYTGIEAGNIFSHGNVGIGTLTVPDGYKLAVDGNVVAEKIVVKNSTNWPDYVFKRGYRLPSLADVERFINQHAHLPEIPSAKEVEAKGQDLGEMNRLLLKKVEELTLYVIEQQKQISTLKEQNKEIENIKKDLLLLKKSMP